MAVINSTPDVRVYVSTDDPRGMRKVVTTQFDSTADTVLSNIPGLSVDVEAGKTYLFDALILGSFEGGILTLGLNGTATVSSMNILEWSTNNSNWKLYTAFGASGMFAGFSQFFKGAVTFSGAGTFNIQAAQFVSDATASSVLVGSHMELREVI